jgi:hypothetical protein
MTTQLQDAKIKVILDFERAHVPPDVNAERKRRERDEREREEDRERRRKDEERGKRPSLPAIGAGAALSFVARTAAQMTALFTLEKFIEIGGATAAAGIREGEGISGDIFPPFLRGPVADAIEKVSNALPWIKSKVLPFIETYAQARDFAIAQQAVGTPIPGALPKFAEDMAKVNRAHAEMEFQKEMRKREFTGRAIIDVAYAALGMQHG